MNIEQRRIIQAKLIYSKRGAGRLLQRLKQLGPLWSYDVLQSTYVADQQKQAQRLFTTLGQDCFVESHEQIRLLPDNFLENTETLRVIPCDGQSNHWAADQVAKLQAQKFMHYERMTNYFFFAEKPARVVESYPLSNQKVMVMVSQEITGAQHVDIGIAQLQSFMNQLRICKSPAPMPLAHW